MKQFKNQFKWISLILGLIFTVGLTIPTQTSACTTFWEEIIQTYQDLFDPILMPWEEPAPLDLNADPEDYARLGLVQGPPEPWEDGIRTDPNEYSFEWWYFDGHFTDGSSIVMIFYTKPQFTPDEMLSPIVSIEIVSASGTKYTLGKQYSASEASFSETACNVEIGPNSVVDVNQDLTTYVIQGNIADEGVQVNLTLQRNVPKWRPGTGIVSYGEELESVFGWLPAVPHGTMSGSLTYGGSTYTVTGSGYHDHNFGNADMTSLIKKWWWTRSQVGDYTVITAYERLKNKYGYNIWLPVFVVLDQNSVLFDLNDADTDMTVTLQDYRLHPDSSYPGILFPYRQIFYGSKTNGDYAELTYNADTMMLSADLLEFSGLTEEEILLARLMGKSPWYTRFISDATLEFDINGVQYNNTVDKAGSVELMELE